MNCGKARLLDRMGPNMTVFVATIKGRGIAAFHAANDTAAETRTHDLIFRDDLMVLETDGVPLWDGIANIEIREARPNEVAKWRTSRATAIRQGNIEENDDAWVAFLVALTDADRRARHDRT